MADGTGPGRTLQQGLAAGLNALLPGRCLACAVVVDGVIDGVIGGADFCPVCREQVVRASAPGVLVYAGPLVDVIHRAKYSRDLGAALGLVRLLVLSVDGLDGAQRAVLDAVDVVTCVPAHWTRAVGRGFDLPALLADGLASRVQRPWRRLLRAGRRDPRLADADSVQERARLVQGRFRLARGLTPSSVAGMRVLLVDDVHTTGATLAEAAAVLADAGADVVVLALAWTPPPSDPVDEPPLTAAG